MEPRSGAVPVSAEPPDPMRRVAVQVRPSCPGRCNSPALRGLVGKAHGNDGLGIGTSDVNCTLQNSRDQHEPGAGRVVAVTRQSVQEESILKHRADDKYGHAHGGGHESPI